MFDRFFLLLQCGICKNKTVILIVADAEILNIMISLDYGTKGSSSSVGV